MESSPFYPGLSQRFNKTEGIYCVVKLNFWACFSGFSGFFSKPVLRFRFYKKAEKPRKTKKLTEEIESYIAIAIVESQKLKKTSPSSAKSRSIVRINSAIFNRISNNRRRWESTEVVVSLAADVGTDPNNGCEGDYWSGGKETKINSLWMIVSARQDLSVHQPACVKLNPQKVDMLVFFLAENL